MDQSTKELQQFLILAKNATGNSLQQLVQQATSHPRTFVFGELLDLPNVQKMEETDAQWFKLLQMFAFGTYSEYIASANLPPLNQVQTKKLRILSIVSLASHSKVLPYATLMNELNISNVRELEDLVIDALYVGALSGRMDHQRQLFEVTDALGRDIKPGDLDKMIGVLDKWHSNSQALVESLQTRIGDLQAAHKQTQERKSELETKIAKAKSDLMKKESKGQMDIDMGGEELRIGRVQGRKCQVKKVKVRFRSASEQSAALISQSHHPNVSFDDVA